MVNLENIKKAIKLQKEANYQIDMFGEAHHDGVNEMLELIDNFNLEECNKFLELLYISENISIKSLIVHEINLGITTSPLCP